MKCAVGDFSYPSFSWLTDFTNFMLVRLVGGRSVRGYEHLEPSRLSSCDELAILQTGPATLVGCFHDVARKRVTQWGWRTLIK
jgi:hypothetical protein